MTGYLGSMKKKLLDPIEDQDRAAALALFPLPAETVARLDRYAELLRKWQTTINLVAPSTLPQLWTRHFADSLQVQAAAPEARIWADLGSGGGFPGLVTAIRLADVPGAKVHLIESDQRKAAFLREVSRETKAAAEVHLGRIETVLSALSGIEAVSARALAPLPKLIAYAQPALDNGAVGLFLQGEQGGAELTLSGGAGTFNGYETEVIRSRTGPGHLCVVKKK